MRKIISNTTPILSLLKIGKLELLKKLYGEIVIPNAVYMEIEKGKERIYYTDLSRIEWIKIQNVSSTISKAFVFDLDEGEAEVIILAKETNADLIIMDEALGRHYAKLLDITLTGTLGILLKAKQLGYISEIKPLIYELTQKGVWLSPKIIEKVIGLAKE